uniref:G_PROTEIN_RECEP_F1_2 domain-containing protein n=1 Tax=Panagrellus redivivus TaxID=6233 RepID=A0A7E4VZL3_PANRE
MEVLIATASPSTSTHGLMETTDNGSNPETNGPNYSNSTKTTSHRALPPKVMRYSLYFICVVGIILNLAVFFKRKFRSKRQTYTTRMSLKLLCSMALADTFSLTSLLVMLCSDYLGTSNAVVMDLVCKIDLFAIHAASAFSIWCWLVLSAMRYVALYQPYAHLRLHREPIIAIACIAVSCAVLESWILYDATYFPEFMVCGEVFSETWENRFQLVEITWSYFVPLITITVLDLRVLCCHSIWFRDLSPKFDVTKGSFRGGSRNLHRSLTTAASEPLCEDGPSKGESTSPEAVFTKSAKSKRDLYRRDTSFLDSPVTTVIHTKSPTVFSFSSLTQTAFNRQSGASNKNKRRQRNMKLLRRCLCITLLDLGMNLPNHLLRLYMNLVPSDQLPDFDDFWLGLFQDISQLLYFAQFSLNALYLVFIIYDTPKNRSTTILSHASRTNSKPLS